MLFKGLIKSAIQLSAVQVTTDAERKLREVMYAGLTSPT